MADEQGWVPAGKAAEAKRSATGDDAGDDAFDRLFGQLAAAGPERGQDGGASQVFSQAHAGELRAGVFAPEVTAPLTTPRAALELTVAPTPFAQSEGIAPAAESSEHLREPAKPGPPIQAPTEPGPTAALKASPDAGAPGDFTRIFTQLPTPSSPPPAVLAEIAPAGTAPPEAPKGSFAEAGSPAVRPVPATQQATPPAAAPGEFTRFFQALNPAVEPSPSASPEFAPKPAARESQAAPVAPQAFAPSQPVPAAAPPAAPASAPGAFTAFFQAAGPASPSSHQAFASASQPTLDPRPVHPPTPQPAAALDAFDPGPAGAAGSQSAGGGFTELLRSLGSDPVAGQPAPASGFAPPAAQQASQPVREAFSPRPAAPFDSSFSAPQPAPGGGPGEFTQLLASLKAPAAETPGTPPPAAPSSFFAAGSAAGSQPGASEFTRILQGSAARSAEAPTPTFAPAPQSSGAAVGLPIAAPAAMPKLAPPPAPAAMAKTTLQKLLPWILGANAVLLLAIVALVLIFLRHRH